MPNPRLTPEQREKLFRPLFASTVKQLEEISEGDLRVFWALRRKLAKELIYLERGSPAYRGKLKSLKRVEQDGLCALCGEKLPLKGAELDRYEAYLGYTQENTRLVCQPCHIEDQRRKKFSDAEQDAAANP